jgi:hypothetical protein
MRQSGKPLRLSVGPSPENSEFSAAVADAIRRDAKKLAAELKSGATISNDVAARYLRENSLSKLIGDFPEITKQRLRDAIADAWAAGGSFDQIVKAIQGTVGEIGRARAEMIAQTEANSAYCRGRIQLAKESGFREKQWSADGTEACEECQKQIAARWIPINEPFPGGVMAPCLHHGCDCGVDFRTGGASG